MADPIRVLIADDHPLLRDGIAVLIANCDDIVVVGQAETGREAVDAHRTLRPDVTLMDLQLPDTDGADVIRAIKPSLRWRSGYEGRLGCTVVLALDKRSCAEIDVQLGTVDSMDQHPKIQWAPDGTLLLNFGEYGRAVEVAAISGGGQRVLTVREVGVAEIWDAVSGRCVGEIRPDSPLRGTTGTAPVAGAFQVFIEAAALNHDGSAALLGLNDGTAGIFRVSDGLRIATLHRPEQPASDWSVIRAVAFSPDGGHALVGFRDRSAGVWSENGDQLVTFLEAPDGGKLFGRPFVRDTLVSSIAMSPDNRWLFAGNVDMTATIWDVTTGQVVFTATEHAEQVIAVFDTAAGFGWVTTGGSVWRSRGDEAPEKVVRSGEHWEEARVDGTMLLTRGFGGNVKQWDLAGGAAELLVSDGPRGFGSAQEETLAFHSGWILYPEGKRRLTVRRGTQQFTIEHDGQLVTARFAPAGNAVATRWGGDLDLRALPPRLVEADRDVGLWSVPGGELIHKFPSPGGVGAFAFSPDGGLIAIGEIGNGGGVSTHVYVYDTATGRQQQSHGTHQRQVSQVEFSPDGNCMASLGDDIVVWDLDRRCVRQRIAADRTTTRFRFLPDGRLLVVSEGSARVYRARDMILQWPVPVGFRTQWCVSDDARTLTIALNQGVIRFDLETGAVRGTCEASLPRPDWVPPASLATEIDARVWAGLWKTEYGTFVHQSDGPRGWVQRLHLSPEGLIVVPAAGGAAVIRVGSEPRVVGRVPFEGTLRATRIVDGEVLLVNEHGKLFRQRPVR